MNVSVIYVNYKTSELIKDSIRSVMRHTVGINYEIIVVDNHSEDDSIDSIQKEFPEVITIVAPDNLGFGRANNLGIDKAQGECVFFLNPDTLLRNNAISLLYHFLMSHEEVGACGGNLFDETGQPTTSFSLQFPSISELYFSIFYLSVHTFKQPRSLYFNHTGGPLEVASIIGADLMVKKSVLDKTGAFDPDFFLNYEETELCYRIHKAGYRIVSVPEAEIIHFEGRSNYIKQSRLFFLYEGQYIYFYKKGGFKTAKKVYRLTQLKNRIRILQFHILYNKRKIEYWKMKSETNLRAFESFKKDHP